VYDPDRLLQALRMVNDWSLPSTYAQTKVHHGYRRAALVQAGHWLPVAELFWFVLNDFSPTHEVWISHIDPGGFIVPHNDASRWRERWQVPIQPAGVMVLDGVETTSEAGVPFPVAHWAPHSVWNLTDKPRIHLVIDLARYIERPAAPFQTFPIPERYHSLISSGS